MRINSFNHFRAIAIIFIIAGHSIGAVGMEFNTQLELIAINLITGGTTLFVFVSGFLFHHVFYHRFIYKKFLFQKFKNLFIPYIVLCIIPIYLYVTTRNNGFGDYFLPNDIGVISEYLIPIFKYFISGRFLFAYWYIPFIMLMFALSPLHVKYIKTSVNFQLSLIFIFSLVSIYMHRSIYNIDILQSLFYFTPIYLIGITVSIHKEKVYEKLKGKEIYLIGTVVFFAIIQSYSGVFGSYHKQPFEYGGIDLMFLHKITFCFFFMIWLHRFESYTNKLINTLAATSFALYFIHPFIIWFVMKLNLDFLLVNSWVAYALFVSFITFLSVIIAKITKIMLPKYSRYIFGY